jgi:hypothetical protein
MVDVAFVLTFGGFICLVVIATFSSAMLAAAVGGWTRRRELPQFVRAAAPLAAFIVGWFGAWILFDLVLLGRRAVWAVQTRNSHSLL